jgi:Domain of unknown function (DUF4388)
VSLSGNLGFVPIDEVLRLLTRSKQQGSVDVTGGGLRGRVFVGKGGIDLATTWGDEDLHRHLINSGFTDEGSLRRVTSGETTLAAIAESNQDMVDLLREMTVESLYQISHRGDEFEVQEGKTTPYASPKSFELESLLEDARERQRDWDKVSGVIPDLTGAIGFRRDLGEREEVTVRVDDWKILSEIGTGSSVNEIADRLGTTEFWTARVAARLLKEDLIVLATNDIPAHAPVRQEATWDDDAGVTDEVSESYDTPVDAVEADDYADEGAYDNTAFAGDTAEQGSHDVYQPEPADEVAEVEEAPHNESWWQEPTEDDEAGSPDQDPTSEDRADEMSEIPHAEAEGSDDDSNVGEDTEAFLEKVFSELESSEPETEEGHGLLRRRRMGTLRDFSSDS